jgi:hypothetical protein
MNVNAADAPAVLDNASAAWYGKAFDDMSWAEAYYAIHVSWSGALHRACLMVFTRAIHRQQHMWRTTWLPALWVTSLSALIT